MTLNLVDDITRTKGQPMRECLGQGLANIICGLFGGMGGCAMIGQSMINVGSGARSRLSSIFAALFLLIVVLVGYPAINAIPVSALAGVMFNVVYHTFEWGTVPMMFVSALPRSIRESFLTEDKAGQKIRRVDAFVIFLVTVVTLLTDLAVAVFCGVVVSCCMFAWDCTELVSVSTHELEDDKGNTVKVYDVHGIIFFGSTTKFLTLFDADNDPDHIRIVFESGFVCDYSALEALNSLGERYGKINKEVSIVKLKPGCRQIVQQSHSLFVLGVVSEPEVTLPKNAHHHLNVETQDVPQLLTSTSPRSESPRSMRSGSPNMARIRARMGGGDKEGKLKDIEQDQSLMSVTNGIGQWPMEHKNNSPAHNKRQASKERTMIQFGPTADMGGPPKAAVAFNAPAAEGGVTPAAAGPPCTVVSLDDLLVAPTLQNDDAHQVGQETLPSMPKDADQRETITASQGVSAKDYPAEVKASRVKEQDTAFSCAPPDDIGVHHDDSVRPFQQQSSSASDDLEVQSP
jgi:hypothetical protein